MAREPQFIHADILWQLFDDISCKLDAASENTEASGSELIKLVIFARRELLNDLIECLHSNQMSFADLCGSLGCEVIVREDS